MARSSIDADPLPVQPLVDGTKDDFENAIPIQTGTINSLPRHRIDDVPTATHNHILDPIIELPQRLSRAPLLSDLEKLNADLPRWRLELVEFLRHIDDDAFRIVGRDAVGDDDDVERLDGVEVRLLGFAFAEVRFQDGVEAGAGRGASAGPDGVEDPLYVPGSCDVSVAGVVSGV